MFERFTERSRRVVVLAQEEAGRFGHNYIGTEHLLLGLVRVEEGVCRPRLRLAERHPRRGARAGREHRRLR